MESNSSQVSYASPLDFITRVDVEIPGLLCRDDQTVATPAALLTDPVLQTCLEDASGAVEAQCLIARRYTPDDLQALTGVSRQFLKRIVCGLTIQYLRWRRGMMEPSTYPMYLESMKWLEALSDGEAIFALVQVEKAGLPHSEAITASDLQILTPTRLTNNPRQWGIRVNQRGWGGRNQCDY
jgi:hypothetical protein